MAKRKLLLEPINLHGVGVDDGKWKKECAWLNEWQIISVLTQKLG